MSRIFHIQKSVRELFEAHGLDDFSPWMHGDVGDPVSLEVNREVRRIVVDGEIFYLKRRRGERWLRLLALLPHGVRPASGPLRELRLVHALAAAGFAVMEPVAWGETRKAGLPVEGFLVVRAIPGRSLADVFDDAGEAQRRMLMHRMGGLVGRLHAAGFFQHLRLKDLILSPDGEMVIIDRESGQPWTRRFSRATATTSLARAARRTLRDGHQMSVGAVGAFLKGYHQGLGEKSERSFRDLTRQVMLRFRKEMKGR